VTQKTNAARLLDRMGIRYQLREYEVDPEDLAAESVAAKTGLPPFKAIIATPVEKQTKLDVGSGSRQNRQPPPRTEVRHASQQPQSRSRRHQPLGLRLQARGGCGSDRRSCNALSSADGIDCTGSLQTELCRKGGGRRTIGGCTEADLRAIEPNRLHPKPDFPGSRFRCGDLRGSRFIEQYFPSHRISSFRRATIDRRPLTQFFAPFRKNNIVTGAVPLFRHACRVPFWTTTSPFLR
jgi:hypothetical protein